MLGYDLEDLNIMIDTCSDAALQLESSHRKLSLGLLTTLTFLQGLWAEGYFE